MNKKSDLFFGRVRNYFIAVQTLLLKRFFGHFQKLSITCKNEQVDVDSFYY